MEALILVDLQNDFLPGGALAVPRGDEVLPVARRLIPRFEHVVATQDWHPADHQSFATQHPGQSPGALVDLHGLPQVLWPDHCVQGSPGARFAEELTLADAAVFQKGCRVDVDSYSGFFDNGRTEATGLEAHLRERGVKTLAVLGLATDYCVRFTVLDALDLGFDIKLIVDGCRGVNLKPGDSEEALRAMATAGAQLTNSAELSRHTPQP